MNGNIDDDEKKIPIIKKPTAFQINIYFASKLKPTVVGFDLKQTHRKKIDTSQVQTGNRSWNVDTRLYCFAFCPHFLLHFTDKHRKWVIWHQLKHRIASFDCIYKLKISMSTQTTLRSMWIYWFEPSHMTCFPKGDSFTSFFNFHLALTRSMWYSESETPIIVTADMNQLYFIPIHKLARITLNIPIE